LAKTGDTDGATKLLNTISTTGSDPDIYYLKGII